MEWESCSAAILSRHQLAGYDGWTTYTAYNSSTPTFNAFTGYFSVPDNPAQDPEVLYVFTGLQNNNWIPIVTPEPPVFDIIQPVLQYPSTYGQGWSVRSWYVTLNAGALVSDEIFVGTGDNIFGNMTRLGPQEWIIVGQSSKTGQSTSLHSKNSRLTTQPWAYTTIECYGCNGCQTYPTQPVEFTKMVLINANHQSETATWQNNPYVSQHRQCQESATIYDSAHVALNFRSS